MRAVVTGTGRCGTGYVAQLLQELGINATHEGVYGHGRTVVKKGREPDVDVSWMAAMDADICKTEGIQLVQLIRHPLDVIASMAGIRFFSNPAQHTPYDRCVHRFMSTWGDDLIDAPRWWGRVNWWLETWTSPSLIPNRSAEHTFRVEMLREVAQVRRLLRAVGHRTQEGLLSNADIQAALDRVPTNVNHRARRPVDWDDLHPPFVPLLLSQARRYGYEV